MSRIALLFALMLPLAAATCGDEQEDDGSGLKGVVVKLDGGLAGTGGYEKAEVTRGGVRLAELHRVTLESRLHPGLWLCGEVVDATGRLGGFNFQWAWASGFAAGAAIGRGWRSA